MLSPYVDASGKKSRAVDMTKDGMAFLVMGFTGKEAAKFKEAYINRFNEQQTELEKIRLEAIPHYDKGAAGRQVAAICSKYTSRGKCS